MFFYFIKNNYSKNKITTLQDKNIIILVNFNNLKELIVVNK